MAKTTVFKEKLSMLDTVKQDSTALCKLMRTKPLDHWIELAPTIISGTEDRINLYYNMDKTNFNYKNCMNVVKSMRHQYRSMLSLAKSNGGKSFEFTAAERSMIEPQNFTVPQALVNKIKHDLSTTTVFAGRVL